MAEPDDLSHIVQREVEIQIAKARIASANDLHVLQLEISELKKRVVTLEEQLPYTERAQPADRQNSALSEHSRFGSGPQAEMTVLIPSGRLRKTATSLEEGWVREPPETIFSYCVWRLALAESPATDPALYKLLVMLAIQVVLVFGFMNCLHLQYESFAFGDTRGIDIGGKSQSELSVSVCWYAPMVVHNQPIIDIVCSLLVIILVASRLMVQDLQTLTTAYPEPIHEVSWIKGLVRYTWWVQACWLPVMLGNSAALLLATSSNVEDVLFNALALTFLLDIDDMMYESFVTSTMKREYIQAAARIPIDVADAENNANTLFAIGCTQCCAAYVYFNVSLRAGIFETGLLDLLERGLAMFILFYGIRFAVFHRVGGGPKCLSSLSYPYLSYAVYGFLGFLHYLVLNTLFQPKFLGRWIYGPNSLLTCF